MSHPSFNKIKIFRLLLSILIVSFTSPSFALLIPGQNKTIGIRTSNTLTVDMQPIKTSFWVNEKIRLRSKGNKPYYLYLFNVDPKTGEAIMILPNKLQPNNYYGHQGYIVPSREIEFYSDRPGQEQIIMVASTKMLNVDLGSYKSIGNFVTGKSATFEKSLGIRFTAPKPKKANPDLLVKTFDITIEGERQTSGQPFEENRQASEQSFFSQLFSSSNNLANQATSDPVAFISSANNEYIDGEQFKLVFGANQKGYVHLYSIDPYGAYDLLKIVPVNGNDIQSLTIQASPPYGRHTLVALFDDKNVVNHKRIADISLNPDKALFVVNQSKRAIAMHPVVIKPFTKN